MGQLRDTLRIKLGYYLSLSGMSQKELADRLKVSQSSITNWLKGNNSPDIDLIAEICNVFDIQITDLMDINKNPSPENKDLEEEKTITLYNVLVSNGILKPSQELTTKQLQVLEAITILLSAEFD